MYHTPISILIRVMKYSLQAGGVLFDEYIHMIVRELKEDAIDQFQWCQRKFILNYLFVSNLEDVLSLFSVLGLLLAYLRQVPMRLQEHW